MNKADQKGSVLIAVLWSLFFLASLALVINVSIAPQLELTGRLRDRNVLHYFADAGVKRAILELRLDETENVDTLNDLWGNNEEAFNRISLEDEGYFSLTHPDGESGAQRYGLIDEERKININMAPANVLKRFFQLVGEVSSQEAAEIADAMIDWRDGDDERLDNGAEDMYYESLNPGYSAKNGAFEILEELLLVKGVTPGIFDKVKGRMTVYSRGAVNINTADEVTLQSLGMSESLAGKIVVMRNSDDGEEATEDDFAFTNVENILDVLAATIGLLPQEQEALDKILEEELLTVQSEFFLGQSTGGFLDRDASKKIVFVVDRGENIRYWREE